MGVFYRADRERWFYDFMLARRRHAGMCTDADGVPSGSRRAAEHAEERVRVAAQRARRTPAPMPSAVYTLAQALAAYVAQADRGSAYWQQQRGYVAELRRYFGDDMPLAAIDETRIAEYVAWARAQPMRVYVGGPVAPGETRRRKVWKDGAATRSEATINKYLIALRKTLKIAHRSRDALGRRLLDDVPLVPTLKVPRRIPRPMPDAAAGALLHEGAQHVAEAAALSLLLGMRRAEAYGCTVAQVDFHRGGVWIRGEETKGRRDAWLPANADAMQLLRHLVDQAKARGIVHLVAYRAPGAAADGRPHPWRPVRSPKRAIRTALKRAGVAGQHRFHDLKGSYTTGLAHVAAGPIVQKLARHKSYETTEAYIEIADDAARAAVDALTGRPAVAGLDLSRPIGKVPTKIPTKPAATPSRKKLSA